MYASSHVRAPSTPRPARARAPSVSRKVAVLARMGNAGTGERVVLAGQLLGTLEWMEKGEEACQRFDCRQVVDVGACGGANEYVVLVCRLSYPR